MNLVRILLLLGAIWLLWRLYRNYRSQIQRRDTPRAGPDYQLTSRCQRCGVHAPRNTLSSAGLCGRCKE